MQTFLACVGFISPSHIYYTFDDQEVVVRAFWGARRSHRPLL
jgi:hypothetical protein